MSEVEVPLSVIKDLVEALDTFWPYIEARNDISPELKEKYPDYISLGDDLENAFERVKVRLKDWDEDSETDL